MNKTQQALGTEPVGKLLLQYSLPAIIGMMVNGLYNVVDRIFIGNIPDVGPLAIAGLGVTMPIMTIILAFGLLIGIGTATNISIKLGSGQKEQAEKLIGNAFSLAVIVGLAITVIGLIFSEQILTLFGASTDSLIYAKMYIDIILVGSIFNILSICLGHLIRGDGNPKLSALIMAAGCLMNIVLDAVFIFIFDMGIQGAALATVLSQAMSALWGLSYYFKGKSSLHFDKANLRLTSSSLKAIFAIGMAPFSMQIAASCVQIISNNALSTHGGDLAIGAMATISSIIMMIGMPIIGITQGAQPIIGYNYGQKRYDRSDKTFKIACITSTLGFVIGWIIIQLFPEPIVSMFNNDPELIALTADGLRKYLSLMPVIGLSMVGSQYMQAIGKAKQSMFLSLLRQAILLIPMVLVLPTFLGLDGVWFAQPIADLIAFFVTGFIVFKQIKSHQDSHMVNALEHS